MQVPDICKLNADTAMKEVLKKAPFYLPEWNTEDEKDSGIVLSHIFSDMVDLISSRLNEAPKKHLISFLEIVNTSLIPANPARVPLTFILSEGASEDVLLKAFTQASADDPDGKAVIFETEKNILATPSKLVSVFSVIKEKDKIFSNTNTVNGVEITELFAGDSLQKHVLYIGDENLFNVQQREQIELELGGEELEKLTDKNIVEWKHSVESIIKENGKEDKKIEWKSLETKFVGKRLILNTEKLNTGTKSIDKVKLNEIESRWLRCELKDSKIEDLKNLSINIIKALASPLENSDGQQKSRNIRTGIIPDYLFSNDIPLDPNSDFYPFGKKPYLYDTFYISSKDAFSKKEKKVTLMLSLIPGRPNSIIKEGNSTNSESSPLKEIDIPQLSWEFWDGESWSLLPVKGGDEWQKNFYEKKIEPKGPNESKPDESEEYKQAASKETTETYELTIEKMPEVKLTRVNGKENYWIRIRMVGGNYGKEYEIVSSGEIIDSEGNKIPCAKVVSGQFIPPQITDLKINYDNINSTETDKLKQPDYIFTENNLSFKSRLEELINNKSFKPFKPLPDTPPAIYFGFDKELKKGPFSLFINVDESIEYPEKFLPKIKWQYLINVDPEAWEELEVLDETAGFTKKGMVQFNLPGKTKASELFGMENEYWIKAVITEDFFTDTARDFVNQMLTLLYLEKLKTILNNPPEIYFGFDKEHQFAKEHENEPVKFSINYDEGIEYPEAFLTKLKWQYLINANPEEWKELEVQNETNGLIKKEFIKVNIPGKIQASELFGLENQCWIRAVITKDIFPSISDSDDIRNQILTSVMVYQMLTSLKVDSPQLKYQTKIKNLDFIKELFDDLQSFLVNNENMKYHKKFRSSINKELENLNKILEPIINIQKIGRKLDISVEGKENFKIFNVNLFSDTRLKLPPEVRGFYLNSAWAVQSKTIHDELLGSGNGEVNQKLKLVNAPVINETVWINEFITLSEKDKKTLLAEPNRVKLNQDSKGNITEFWVKWKRVSDFLGSKSKDRDYTIDKTDGNVSFGNGIRGMVPPIGFDNIKVTYSIGGGISGNFDALKISKLQSSIAFVDKVFNPISSSGGTETEDIDILLKRAPTTLKNRDRATALEDYEWLAKEASDQVARVKALPNFNSERKFSTGWVTVVIVPQSSSSKPVPSSELKRRVTCYLKERCPAVVKLRVIPPYYIKVDVSAELITASIDAMPVIEKEARNKIYEFLHPLTGSTERDGWDFGDSLCISDIYSILEQITNVDYVSKVMISLYDDSSVISSAMKLGDISTVAKLPVYALPYSGEHEITVKLKNINKEG